MTNGKVKLTERVHHYPGEGDAMAAKWVPVAELKAWQENPRKNDHAVPAVMESIKRFGFAAPILARMNGEVIAGHTRLKAALELRLDRVPVRFLDLTDNEARLLALADNRTGEIAFWDDAALGQVIAKLKKEGERITGLGWSDNELDLIIKGIGSIDDAEWADAFGDLPDSDREPLQQIKFTLSDEQAEQVRAAMAHAKALGEFEDTGNENSNGNAIARVCELFLTGRGVG